jgi:CPA2 family monovalent cation:H+ antiporter-2
MFDESWIKELLIVLATAGVVVPLFGRFRVGVVPGFLIAGVILGPAGLGRLADDHPWLSGFTFSTPEHVLPFAELGVLFLLFLIGLEFSLERLWSMRRLVLGLGPAQFFGSVALILAGVAWLDRGLEPALVVGLALALSSTAIVTQVLIEAHRFAAPVGRVSIGVLLFQDLMVVPIVIVIGLMAGEELAVSGAVTRAIALAVAALAIIALAGRYLIGPLLRLAGATGNRELVVAIALFLAIGTALLTGAVGLSPALGAFLAGLLLGESEYRHQLEVDIEPFKGLLIGLFFMTVGMSLDLVAIASAPASYLGAVLALILAKFLVVALAARLFGIGVPVTVEAGFVLAGAGEFAFVAFTLALHEQVIDPAFHQFAVSVAALSMLAIPGLAILGRQIGTALQNRSAETRDGVDGIGADRVLSDHVVIGGLGRVGQAVARVLEAEQIPYVAVDMKADLVAAKRRAGEPVYFGDASRREILEKLGGARARAFVVTTDKPEAAERMVKAILRAWPKATIHARALDVEHARRLSAIGVTDVVPEALEGSLQLAGRVLAAIGLPDDAIDARLDVAREAEIRRLVSDKN